MAVFDGHGGAHCSEYCSEEAPALFADALDEAAEKGMSPKDAILKVFQNLAIATQSFADGSTASVVYIPWDKTTSPWSATKVYVAILGDSPVIVKDANGTIVFSPEHNARTNVKERKAAQNRGAFYIRGYLHSTLDQPGLQMSRSFGDRHLGRILSRVPEVYDLTLGVGSWVLACTDGAIDPSHGKGKSAFDSVVQLIEGHGTAQHIVDRAVAAPTEDNVTAMLVRIV
jgi:serine/threonine protein phosphatase PrpC